MYYPTPSDYIGPTTRIYTAKTEHLELNRKYLRRQLLGQCTPNRALLQHVGDDFHTAHLRHRVRSGFEFSLNHVVGMCGDNDRGDCTFDGGWALEY